VRRVLSLALYIVTGQLVGAAACAVGCLINSLAHRQGFFPDPGKVTQQAAAALVTAAELAPRLAQSASVKLGAAAGLAALLGAKHLLPGLVGDTSYLLTRSPDAEAAKETLQVSDHQQHFPHGTSASDNMIDQLVNSVMCPRYTAARLGCYLADP
jgi:hypothetical protein